jgi:O-succinylhomoserine sulfhydrylase
MNPAQPQDLHPDTLAVRRALPRSVYGEHSEALYLTSSFVQPDAETAARRFAGEEDGFTYSRTSNPTVTSFEQRLAALEGTESAIGTASGMSAILLMAWACSRRGPCGLLAVHVRLHHQAAWGGVGALRRGTSFVPQTDSSAWKAAMRPNTRCCLPRRPPTR